MNNSALIRIFATYKLLFMAKKILKLAFLLAFACNAFMAQAQGNGRYHTVEEGQTLYSIARLYGVSPSDIQKLNPEVGDLIRPGDKLRIPDGATRQQMAEGPGAQFVGNAGQSTATGVRGKVKTTYQVKKKDTLYRIALEHGVSIQDILNLNPGLTENGKLKKGDWISIPYTREELQAEQKRQEAARTAQAAPKAAAKKSGKSHLNVAVVLPFKENTERGGKMVEFYQGFLMAADSVRKLGTSVDVYAYHSGAGVTEINSILERNEMKHMDLIFGPLDGVQANVLSTFCQQNHLRLVMPFATTNTYGLNNPYVYLASPSSDVVTRGGAAMVSKRFSNSNIVVAYAGAADNKRGTNFVSQLIQQMSTRSGSPRHLDIDADDAEFLQALNISRHNLVVVNTTSQQALQRAVRRLRAFKEEHPDCKISLLGYPEWSTYQGSILQDFYALDTYVFSSFYRNPSENRIQVLEQRFKVNFHHDMIKTSPRYGIMGLDLGFFFMRGLSQLGDYFDERQQTLRYDPFQHGYLFTQKGDDVAHVNSNVTLIHYTPAGKIEVER